MIFSQYIDYDSNDRINGREEEVWYNSHEDTVAVIKKSYEVREYCTID